MILLSRIFKCKYMIFLFLFINFVNVILTEENGKLCDTGHIRESDSSCTPCTRLCSSFNVLNEKDRETCLPFCTKSIFESTTVINTPTSTTLVPSYKNWWLFLLLLFIPIIVILVILFRCRKKLCQNCRSRRLNGNERSRSISSENRRNDDDHNDGNRLQLNPMVVKVNSENDGDHNDGNYLPQNENSSKQPLIFCDSPKQSLTSFDSSKPVLTSCESKSGKEKHKLTLTPLEIGNDKLPPPINFETPDSEKILNPEFSNEANTNIQTQKRFDAGDTEPIRLESMSFNSIMPGGIPANFNIKDSDMRGVQFQKDNDNDEDDSQNNDENTFNSINPTGISDELRDVNDGKTMISLISTQPSSSNRPKLAVRDVRSKCTDPKIMPSIMENIELEKETLPSLSIQSGTGQSDQSISEEQQLEQATSGTPMPEEGAPPLEFNSITESNNDDANALPLQLSSIAESNNDDEEFFSIAPY